MAIRLKIDATSLIEHASSTAPYLISLRHPCPKFWVSLNCIDSPSIGHLLYNIQSSFLNVTPSSFTENLNIELYLDDALLAPSLPSTLLHDGEKLILKAASCEYGYFSQILSIASSSITTTHKPSDSLAQKPSDSLAPNNMGSTTIHQLSSVSNIAALPSAIAESRIKKTRRGGRRVQAAKKRANALAGSTDIASDTVDAPVCLSSENETILDATRAPISTKSSTSGVLPRGHVYFDDEGLPLSVTNNEAPSASAASTQFSSRRQKRRGFVALDSRELSVLQQQEGFSDDHDVSALSSQVPSDLLEDPYSSCPPLTPGLLPAVGDLLAFHELELDPDTMTPRATAQRRVASVLCVDPAESQSTASVRLRLRADDAPDEALEYTLGTLLDVRLVRPAAATATATADVMITPSDAATVTSPLESQS